MFTENWWILQFKKAIKKLCTVSLNNHFQHTNHEINNTGEEYAGDCALSDDVRQDLRQEVDGHSVVSTCVFMTANKVN